MQKMRLLRQFVSPEIVDLKIMQSAWLTAFGFHTRKQGFSKYRIFAETQQIIYTFTIEQIL